MEDHYSCDTKWWHYLTAIGFVLFIFFGLPWLMVIWMFFAGGGMNP